MVSLNIDSLKKLNQQDGLSTNIEENQQTNTYIKKNSDFSDDNISNIGIKLSEWEPLNKFKEDLNFKINLNNTSQDSDNENETLIISPKIQEIDNNTKNNYKEDISLDINISQNITTNEKDKLETFDELKDKCDKYDPLANFQFNTEQNKKIKNKQFLKHKQSLFVIVTVFIFIIWFTTYFIQNKKNENLPKISEYNNSINSSNNLKENTDLDDNKKEETKNETKIETKKSYIEVNVYKNEKINIPKIRNLLLEK